MKKIAILNDIHGNLYLLNKALNYLKDKNISLYLVCGDFLTDGPDDNKVIETLRNLPTEIILGNREESLLSVPPDGRNLNEKMYPLYYTYHKLTKENINFLKQLSPSKIINVDNYNICLSHGSPYKTRDIVKKDSRELFSNLIKDYPSDIYFFAHTHRYFNVSYHNKMFINTGAINCFLGKSSTTTFGILTINDSLVSYEQIELPFDFNEVKDYYFRSNYYKSFPEWTNIILCVIKYGINFHTKFSREYDFNQSMNKNFHNFIKTNNLPDFTKGEDK